MTPRELLLAKHLLEDHRWTIECAGDHLTLRPGQALIKKFGFSKIAVWRFTSVESALGFIQGFYVCEDAFELGDIRAEIANGRTLSKKEGPHVRGKGK